jgi:hypothetical protein
VLEVNSGVLRVWDELPTRSEAGDEAAACSGVGIEDGKYQRHGSV